jgi:ATP-binding cassette subfamily F protein uup
LPGEIDAMQAELDQLQARIADPGLYARDRKGFDAAMARISVLTASIAAAEEKWLELEALRETLEG